MYIGYMNDRYIIFADDDADDLELVTGLFKQYNKEVSVLEFKNGKDVMKFLDDFALRGSLPQLIVLGINMPRMNGMETLVAIRDHYRFRLIPVVIYTTSTSRADQEFCDKYGASWVNKTSSVEGVRQTAKVLAEFCELQNH